MQSAVKLSAAVVLATSQALTCQHIEVSFRNRFRILEQSNISLRPAAQGPIQNILEPKVLYTPLGSSRYQSSEILGLHTTH